MKSALPLSFVPDPGRAGAAVVEMKRRLAVSLRHIRERASPHISLPKGRIERALAEIDGDGRIQPVLFAIHADMLAAIDADDMAELQSLFEEVDRRSFVAADMALRPFTAAELDEGDMERYSRHAATDPDVDFCLVAPEADECGRFVRDVGTAMAALNGAAPEVAGEIDTLTTEIVIAAHDPARSMFDGITAFPLWGALTLNPRVHVTVADVLEVLVHEATHTLLYAFCLDEPLVLNPFKDRFASPVRSDPRPMDGLFHGVYVLARIHYALDRVVEAGTLDDENHAIVEKRLSSLREVFFKGIEPIHKHARFTETGRAVLDDAERYMERAS